MTQCNNLYGVARGEAIGGYIGIYTLTKSGQVSFLWINHWEYLRILNLFHTQGLGY